MENKKNDAYVNICGVPTHIYTWGKWIEETFVGKEVAICITGNPGVAGFYTEWGSELYNKMDRKIPVWIIGHLGHDDPPESSIQKVPQLKGNERQFDLNAQIRHKIEFIKRYVPADVKIHLIGHSIGAWMILQMLQEDSTIKSRLKKCYLLFPTIERMRETSNGLMFTRIAQPMQPIIAILLMLFNLLPQIIRIFIIQVYFWFNKIPNVLIGSALKYFEKPIMEKVIFLAGDEMERVGQLQNDLVREHSDKLKLFYGTTDGWVPIKYYQELHEQFPNIDAHLDTMRIDHAFVLRHSKSMASIVADMIVEQSDIL